LYVGFGGTTAGGMTKEQLKVDAKQYLGALPPAYRQANEIVAMLKTMYPGYTINISGHSLGGGLAQFAGLMNNDDNRTVVQAFDAAELSREAQSAIGKERLKKASNFITHVSIYHDLVSDFPGLSKIKKALKYFNIKVPENFGKIYYIFPENKKDSYLKRHTALEDYFLTHISKVFTSVAA